MAAVLLPRLIALFFPSATLVGQKAPPIDGMTYIHGTPVQLGQGRVTGNLLLIIIFSRYRSYKSLSLKLSDTRVYEPQMLVRLGTTAHF